VRILILGGTGLISQEIVKQLVSRGDTVFIYNRGHTAADLPHQVTRFTGERSDISKLRDNLRSLALDCVIDMCGYTEGEAAALIRATEFIVPQVIFCSTTDVIIKGLGPYPLDESAPRGASPTFPYAVAKVASELLLEKAAESGAFALTTLRPAQTYGGREHGPQHPLRHRNYQLWRISSGAPIIMHGDGSSLWAACYAPDVARAFIGAVGNKRAFNRTYITASPEIVTWSRYWQIAAEAFSFPQLELVTIPSPVLGAIFGSDALTLMENYRYNNVFDCTRAANDLGFKYTTDLRTGFGAVAHDYGERWIQEGEEERESDYARRYAATLTWWKQAQAARPAPAEDGQTAFQ
jgi:nucleoside-diphosphate-sugar epimerase